MISWLKAFTTGWWWSDPKWWGSALDRVLRSGAQTLIAAILADQLGWFHHWYQIAGMTATMVLLTFLTAIVLPQRTVDPTPNL